MGRVAGGVIQCVDPRTGENTQEIPCTSVANIPGSVVRARAAQVDWSDLPLKERKAAVAALHAAFLARAEDVAEALAQDCGRPAGEA